MTDLSPRPLLLPAGSTAPRRPVANVTVVAAIIATIMTLVSVGWSLMSFDVVLPIELASVSALSIVVTGVLLPFGLPVRPWRSRGAVAPLAVSLAISVLGALLAITSYNVGFNIADAHPLEWTGSSLNVWLAVTGAGFVASVIGGAMAIVIAVRIGRRRERWSAATAMAVP